MPQSIKASGNQFTVRHRTQRWHLAQQDLPDLRLVDPVGYPEFVKLMSSARLVPR
jgi:hypothetical protein